MILVGADILDALIRREKRRQPRLGGTLERRLAAWTREVQEASWRKPTAVKAMFGTADVIGNSRIIFDICGNNYRLVVQFNYAAQIARVRFGGSHAEYDRIDPLTV